MGVFADGALTEPDARTTVDGMIALPCERHMKQRKTTGDLLTDLVTHLLMGGCLGLICAIVVLLADIGHLRDFFAAKPDPRVAELTFALNLSLAFAFGATLTGYIFMQMEKR
jgi:hypothetical protein